MERRLLIAFLLSTALIMAYNFLYYGPRLRKAQELQRAQQERLAQEQATTQSELETAPAPQAVPDTFEMAQPVPEGDNLPVVTETEAPAITVETPLFSVRLSGAGGRITSVRLQQYETEGLPVELVRQDAAGGLLGLRLIGENRTEPLATTLFEPFLRGASEPLSDGATVGLDPTSQKRTVLFRATTPDGRQVERYYTFTADSYVVRTGVRYTSAQFPFARNVEWDFGPGLQATEVNVEDDRSSMRATVRLGEEMHSKKHGDFSEEYTGTVQWASLKTKYFIAILLPEAPTGGEARIAGVKEDHYLTSAVILPAVEQQGRVDQGVDFYMGPQDYRALKAMGRGLERNVSMGFDHVKIFKPVSQAILWSMTAMYKFIPNYGLVIILISVLTKVLFYRLTHKSFKSMRDMQALQPKLAALKEKFKDDRQRLSQETMKLYKESGVNPLGGCLPMLLQMPVFIALFNVLRSTIEVRRAPFFGWMNDLSQQDVLFTLPVSLPVIGSAVSVLPILMGASMLFQSKIGGSIAGPETSSTQPKMLTYMMPIVFTFLFYRMPSGLVLYWLVNTVLSVAQQYYINKGGHPDDNKPSETDNARPEKKGPAKPAGNASRKRRAKKG